MMRKVVVDGHAARRPSMLQPAANALEASERRRHRVGAQSNRRADGDRRQRIAHVVGAQSGTSKLPAGTPPRRTRKDVDVPLTSRSWACQSDPSARPNVSTRQCARVRKAIASALSDPRRRRPARDEIDEPLERQPDRVKIGVDVGVVELDVPDNGDVGQVLLRGLVKERAVVFIALDDELAAAADAIARIEVLGDAARAYSGRRRRRSAASPSVRSLSSCHACR